MKGQSSLEFMILLALVLLMSSILISTLETKSTIFYTDKDYQEAKGMSQKINFEIMYVKSNRNSEIYINESGNAKNILSLYIDSEESIVNTTRNTYNFNSRYEGSNNFTINLSQSRKITYNKGVNIN